MSDQNDRQADYVDEFAHATLELLQELCSSEDSAGKTKNLLVIGKDGHISFAQEYRKLLNSALKTKLENVNFFRKELAKFRSKDAHRIIIASRIRTSTLEFIEAIGRLDESTRPNHFTEVEDDEIFHRWFVFGWGESVSSPEDDKITQLLGRINYYRKQIQLQAQAITNTSEESSINPMGQTPVEPTPKRLLSNLKVTDFAELFGRLFEAGAISYETETGENPNREEFFRQLANHFLDRHDEPFNARSLASVFDRTNQETGLTPFGEITSLAKKALRPKRR